mgnify:CR=1 FL=1
MFPRVAESLVHELLAVFPIVTVTGPRQLGKTTLARKVLAGPRTGRWKIRMCLSWPWTTVVVSDIRIP